MEQTFKELSPAIHLLGRCGWEDDCLCLDWSASGFQTIYRGRRIEFHFSPLTVAEPIYLKVITSEYTISFPVSTGKEVLTLSFSNDDNHKIRILRQSEGNEALLFSHAVYSDGESLTALAPQANRKITFLGDSITCGYGVTASASEYMFHTYQEDATAAYAYLTADAFDADYHIVAISGQGIVRNCKGETGFPIPAFYRVQNRTKNVPFSAETFLSDVIVVAGGTNDAGGSVPKTIFAKEAHAFLDALRKDTPDAAIVWMYGMMNTRYTETIEQVIDERRQNGDSRISFLPIPEIYQEENEVGAVGHPNEKAQKRFAKALCQRISEMTGWAFQE